MAARMHLSRNFAFVFPFYTLLHYNQHYTNNFSQSSMKPSLLSFNIIHIIIEFHSHIQTKETERKTAIQRIWVLSVPAGLEHPCLPE